jgi:hypothetical protein
MRIGQVANEVDDTELGDLLARKTEDVIADLLLVKGGRLSHHELLLLDGGIHGPDPVGNIFLSDA